MYHIRQRFVAAILAFILVLGLTASALAYDTIRFGATGAAVTTLQKALKSKGYYKGTIDGKYGQKTRSAVYRYQKAVGLSTDGKAGNKTLTALYEGLSAANSVDHAKASAIVVKNPKTLYYGCNGSSVKALQRLLRKAGYYKGTIDGKYGDLTLRAVKRYQWAKGLHGDGIAGAKTMESLKGG